jgi:anti-sigma-K factor RskA
VSQRIHDPERLEELRADRAVFGLTPEEEREMAQIEQSAGAVEFDALEQAAAAVALAHAGRRLTRLPSELRSRLQGGARAYFATRAEHAERAPAPLRALPPVASAPPRPRTALAWSAAAAAAVIAVAGWWPRRAEPIEPQVVVAPQARELRERLLAEPAVLRVEAQGTELAKGAGGDVVWLGSAQQGWMRLVGLPVNDPRVEQYQLWIFDAEQQHPVDGGVFNVSASGELLVPIDAKLQVAKPTLFAITIEKPGGVVVSDRQRIAWVAKPI